jgi:hypothetical protein
VRDAGYIPRTTHYGGNKEFSEVLRIANFMTLGGYLVYYIPFISIIQGGQMPRRSGPYS